MGDNTTKWGSEVTHSYGSAGTYPVYLSLDDVPNYPDDPLTPVHTLTVYVYAPTVTVEVSPDNIPRDNASEATVTATLTGGGHPLPGRTVTVTVDGDGEFTDDTTSKQLQTDANGSVTVNVRSKTIGAGGTGGTVRASYLSASDWANIAFNGIEIALTSQYSKVYPCNANTQDLYHYTTTLTAIVKDSTGTPAKGSVLFATDHGTVDPTSRPLSPGGVAESELTPSHLEVVNTAYVAFGPLQDTAQVKFALQAGCENYCEPQKKITENTLQRVTITDSDGAGYPRTKVICHWSVPGVGSYDDEWTTNEEDGTCTFASAPATTAGYGTGSCASHEFTTPSAILDFAHPDNWVRDYLQPRGEWIIEHWPEQGDWQLDDTLKFVLWLLIGLD